MGCRLSWVTTVVAVVTLAAAPALALDMSPAVAQMYADLSLSPPTATYMTVCYGFNCRRRMQLAFTPADRRKLADILAAGRASPAAERKAIQQAVVWWDRRVGPIAGTEKRVPRANAGTFDERHNFDCFDTTRNTTSLLLVVQAWGLLRHHKVGDPRYRGNLILQTPHNTAIVKDRASGRDWAVDPWTVGYAQLPEVKPVEQWLTEK
jgi:hypothetical protein